MTRLYTADASRVTASDFLAALRPAPDPLHTLVGNIWTAAGSGDPVALAAAHKALADWKAKRALTECHGDPMLRRAGK